MKRKNKAIDIVTEYAITPKEAKALMEYLLFLRWKMFCELNKGLL
jgi:hypothetical protein